MLNIILPPFLAQLDPDERTPCYELGHLFGGDLSQTPESSVHYAKELCAGCPARVGCAEYAIQHREPEGIWGGLTPAERRTVASAERPECGTDQAWRSHLSRGEGCTLCRDAHRERQRADWTRRLAAEHEQHGGSVPGYRLERLLGLETCERCRAARQAYYAGRPRPGKWYRRAA